MWKSVYQLHFETKFWNCFFLVVDFILFTLGSSVSTCWMLVANENLVQCKQMENIAVKSLPTFALNTIHVLAGWLAECDIFSICRYQIKNFVYGMLECVCLLAKNVNKF